MIDHSLVSEFNLGSADNDHTHSYRVYVTTFLGFGSNEAIKRYEKMLVDNFVRLSNGSSMEMLVFLRKENYAN